MLLQPWYEFLENFIVVFLKTNKLRKTRNKETVHTMLLAVKQRVQRPERLLHINKKKLRQSHLRTGGKIRFGCDLPLKRRGSGSKQTFNLKIKTTKFFVAFGRVCKYDRLNATVFHLPRLKQYL